MRGLIAKIVRCTCNSLVLLLCLGPFPEEQSAIAQENVVIQWNNAALQAIRTRHPGAPIAARALAIAHTCMFDAWAAYDRRAHATILGASLRRPSRERTEANKSKAISFAAYVCLSDLFPEEIPRYSTIMQSLGYNPEENNSEHSSPEGIGNLAAKSVLEFRHHDGANQLGDLHPGAYSDYTGYVPASSPEHLDDPDHWQPLWVSDGRGRYLEQSFLTPQWSKVVPFALSSGSQFRPKTPPASLLKDRDHYMLQAQEILEMSANLTDEDKMIAEYWSDGFGSDTPPGHWCRLAQSVSQRDHHNVDDDVKMFFLLTNALFDASIAAWDAKRVFDSVRPITAIHFLFKGQQVRAWGGPFQGTETINGEDWVPYQPITGWVPPFPEFVSGHSTFSAAAAEVLRLFTGSDKFGDSVTFSPGSSSVEAGLTPRSEVTLFWPTFRAASDQAGISRRLGGIHFADGDLSGRTMGKAVGQEAWRQALAFINGKR